MIRKEDWRYPYFTYEEMTCKCGCKGTPTPEFMSLLIKIRKEAAFPLWVASGYRCPVHNEIVSSTGKNGPHTMGLACDILISGEKAFALVELALKYGMTGIGILQKGDFSSRFIHIDCIETGGQDPRPRIWSY